MSEEIEDGGPAFPVERSTGFRGMSLRDYFAGQALAGWLAAESGDATSTTEDAATSAYIYADAMIEARKK